MKDKNTVIGFTLMGIMLLVLFWYNNKQSQATMAANEDKRKADSIAKAASIPPEQKENDSIAKLKRDTANKIDEAGVFVSAGMGKEELVTIENELMKVTFSNKGGRVKFVALKNYKSFDSSLVTLGSNNDKLGYAINTGKTAAQTNDLYFPHSPVVKNADGSQSITYSLKDSTGSKSVEHVFTIKPNEYLVDWNVSMNGANQLLTNGSLNINWHIETQQHEKSARYERAQMSNICFSEEKEFDYISAKTERKFEKPVQWVGAVQQFFNTTLITKKDFTSGDVKWARNTVDTSKLLATVDANLQAKVSGSNLNFPMQLYYGPNDYKVLKNQAAPEMDKIINLGRDMYSFVRPINKYIIMPVFNFFASFVKSYGWVILLLTLFIRLLTAPLTYGSYLNGAKMKILRPELDELKKKYKDDQQGFAMAQMKFNKEAGVNMLGGCLPALLQIPIFFALYSFFNSNIALRGESFLWSNDLSAFDAVISWKSEIWGLSWALNNHISLFTITAVITSFLISIYNMSMTPTQDNPALKYMPYIFPFILFFVFNGLPSALTWYYTVSNLITLGLQFTIQNYIINHDKVVAKIEEKRKAPKKGPSKWQERMQQMQETQKKMQDMKNRSQNKK
jgi:YidC/Oxa1 family membrane protein insertase